MSEVILTLNADSLHDLPAGASYHARSGRANLDVRRGTEPGSIVVHASCDSLQRLVEYYERLACRYKETLERQSEEVKEEKKPPGRVVEGTRGIDSRVFGRHSNNPQNKETK